nr:PREDICTED: enolase 4 isoform X2 [Anolis carolinensis]|eukprot:XP_008113022.1 PREDICTED: enolase 4 isoform X2 [Anolis carolinensis]
MGSGREESNLSTAAGERRIHHKKEHCDIFQQTFYSKIIFTDSQKTTDLARLWKSKEARGPSLSNGLLALHREVMACRDSDDKQQRRFNLTDLKHQAVEYYRNNEVPQRLEEVLNTMFYQRPEDFYGYLANYFGGLSKPPVICKLAGKRILDGIGQPTLEVEVTCRIREREKRVCSSTISSHAEMLENASTEAFDADEKERRESVNTAVEWINESLNEMFRGLQPTDQDNIDKLLGEYFSEKAEEDKVRREAEKEKETQEAVPPVSHPQPAAPQSGKKKGAKQGKKASIVEKPILPAEPAEPIVKGSMAVGCISLALAKTAAIISEIPLYMHIALLKANQEAPKELAVPLPMITVLSCGKSSPGKLNLMKEVMLIPPAWLTVKQAIKRCLNIQKQLMKLTEPPVQLPSSMGEGKKSTSRDAKKAPPPVLRKMSHLGCLVIGSESLEHPLTLIQTACANLSLELGTDVYLGLNCAAQELMDYSKGKYEILFGIHKSAEEMVDVYLELTKKFPSIKTFIDPLRKEDKQQWIVLRNTLGAKCHLIAEDSCRNVSKLLEDDDDTSTPKCRGFILKYTNETKISDLVQVKQRLDDRKQTCTLGSPDGESIDDSLVDLAVGLGTKFIKLGGLSRGERVTKYNRLLAIEEELSKNGRLCEKDERDLFDVEEEEEEEEEDEFDCTDFDTGTVPAAL